MSGLNNQQEVVENTRIDFYIPCSGPWCKKEARRVIRSIPVCSSDCYQRYMVNVSREKQKGSYRLPVGIQMAIIKNGKGRDAESLARLLQDAK